MSLTGDLEDQAAEGKQFRMLEQGRIVSEAHTVSDRHQHVRRVGIR